jgi:hypothetical protein
LKLHLWLIPPGRAVGDVGGDALRAVGVTADVAGESHHEEKENDSLQPLSFIQWMSHFRYLILNVKISNIYQIFLELMLSLDLSKILQNEIQIYKYIY